MSDHDPLTLTIPADLSRALREAAAAGECGSADDALADALATWARRHEDREEELACVKASVRAAIHDPRPSSSLEEVDAHLDAFFKNVEAASADEAAYFGSS